MKKPLPWPYRLMQMGLLSTLLVTSAGCSAQSKSMQQDMEAIIPVMTMDITPEERFERLIQSRDSEYEYQRQALFADPQAVAYLATRFDDPDRVTAFIAKELHLWATTHPVEFDEAEEFLKTGIHENKAKENRTAVGWQPDREISKYLHEVDGKNKKNTSGNFFLLNALKHPSNPYLARGINSYFLMYPTSEPEVLIRIGIESPADGRLQGLAEISLRQLDKDRALQALNHERNRALRLKQPFPEELETLRTGIIKGSIDFDKLPFPLEKYRP